MTRSYVIARRELSGYFYSSIAYVAMALFLLASGFVFCNDLEPQRPAEMRNTFDWMIWLLVFVVPVICMGSIAQEWASGTMETMMTAPVSDGEVVLGKYLGALSFVLVLLAPTLVYPVILRLFGRPDWGAVVSGYLGIILAASLFVAVGLFCSALTRSQVVAAVLGATILFAVTVVPWWISSKATLPTFWRGVVNQAVHARYADFSRGVIDTGNIIFFLVVTGVFLFLTVKVLESRRWK